MQETPIAGPFNLLSAPLAGAAPFLGDYQGIAGLNDSFLSFFVAANSGDKTNPSDLFVASPSLSANAARTDAVK